MRRQVKVIIILCIGLAGTLVWRLGRHESTKTAPASEAISRSRVEAPRATAQNPAQAPALATGRIAAASQTAPTAPVATNSQVPVAVTPPGQISPSALRQIAALMRAKAARTPTQRKIDSQLLYADKMRQGLPIADGVPTQRVNLQHDEQGRVLLDIKADVTDQVLQRIADLGGRVINNFPTSQAIRATLPLAAIEKLAATDGVHFVQPAVRSVCSAVTVDSQGDTTHQANLARTNFSVTGSGVKIGVMSDSVDFLTTSQIAGLVMVLSGQSGEPGTGEGTAMLEIVHDLAPGAQLYFATAAASEAGFSNNIIALQRNGCNIIVDDEIYLDESPFEDGPIARAVNTVTAAGTLYFSSASNAGNQDSGTSGTWEGDFVSGGDATGVLAGQGQVHNFGSADYDTVTLGTTQGADLFWSDPLGGASDDYDLYVLDPTGTTVDSSSNNTQDGTQDPYEGVDTLTTGERVVVVLYSGSARFLHLDGLNGAFSISTSGATRGHNCATNAFGVAAVNAAQAYPAAFKGGSEDPVENYSADGPRRVFFQANGTAITPGNFLATGGAVRQKPELAAADGVATDLPESAGFNLFFGTSAAAPHAAAIAALVKSLNPSLTMAQIRTILTNSTLDIMAPGFDRDSGAGIVMAPLALQAAQPDALQVTPGTGLMLGGPVGGPFNTTSLSFTLTNIGKAALNWTLANPASWLTASLTNGTLTPGGGATTVTLALNTSAVSNFSSGVFYANEIFTNVTSGFVQSRSFALSVQSPPIPASYPSNVLALNPIAYWRFNETAQPPAPNLATNAGSLGAAGNGYVIASAAKAQPGIVGNAFGFSNPGLAVTYLGSRIDVPNNPAFNPNGPFTVEFWAKPSQNAPDLFCPVCSLDPDSNGGTARSGWLFYQNTNNWQFRLGGVGGYAATLAGGAVSPGAWQHVAGVYDGTYAYLYVNGHLVVGPMAVSGFNPNQLCPLRIGATTIPNRTFDGHLDEIAFYSRVLSAGEIAAHYSAATTNNAGYSGQILSGSPVGYWRLEDSAYAVPNPQTLPFAFNSGSASNLYGVYQPGSIPGVPGVPSGGNAGNYGVRFNGAAGYVDIPGGLLNGMTGPVTVAAWARCVAANGSSQSVVSGGVTAFHLRLDGTGLPFFGDGLQTAGDVGGSTTLADGQWHMLTGVNDGAGSQFLYVDGQLANSITGETTPIIGNTGDTWIGGEPDAATTQIFYGDIDEVAVFGTALGSSQVQQLYSAAVSASPAVTFAENGGTLTFNWTQLPGVTYQLQYKTNLAQPFWSNLNSTVSVVNSVATTSDVQPTDPQRFYRLTVVP